MQRVDDAQERLRAALRTQLASRERKRRALEDKLQYFDLRPRFRRDRARLNDASARAEALLFAALSRARQRFERASAKLDQLNPRLVLSRGYSIVLNDRGEIVREAAATSPGADLRLLFAKDSLTARVIETQEIDDTRNF